MIVQANPRGWTKIGRLGDNEYKTILFPCQDIYNEIPDAAVTVLHQRPGDPAAYPVNPAYVQVIDGRVYWTTTSADLSKQGRGQAELVFTSGGKVANDIIYTTEIDESLDGSGTPPEPWEIWVAQIVAAGQHAPTVQDGIWYTWDTVREEYVSTEIAAGISGARLTEDYMLVLTFSDGTTATVGPIRGAKGDPGQPGQDYVITQADYDAIAAIVATNASFQQTVQAAEDAAEDARGWANGTDEEGNPVSSDDPHYHNNAYYFMLLCLAATGHYPKVENGYWYIWDVQNEQWATTGVKATGADGVSPTITITSITGGHRITVTDADGDHMFDVMNGTNGTNGVGVPAGGTQGQVLKKKTGTDYDTEWGNEPTVPVQDVQIDGSSILSNGVANIPKGTSSTFGVLAVGGGLRISGSNGKAIINAAGESSIKAGTENYNPIVPGHQHESAFYGLTKAAGVDMSSSSNAVGTYTDAAKKAIRKMLGVPNQEWELIADVTLTEDSDNVIIETDTNGQSFALSKYLARISLTANTTQTNNFFYTYVIAKTTNDNTLSLSSPVGRWPSNGVAGFCEAYAELIGNCVRSEMRNSATSTGNSQNITSSSTELTYNVAEIIGFRMAKYNSSSSPLTTGTNIKLYGVRID